MTELAAVHDSWAEWFAGFEQDAAGRDAVWLERLRRGAFARFRALGFPTTREEDWKGTSVSAIASTAFGPPKPLDHASVAAALRAAGLGETARGPRLVVIAGRVDSRLSSTASLPPGVRLAGLADTLREDPGLVEPVLASVVPHDRRAFAALNTAFLVDGAVVVVEADTAVEPPIEIVFVSGGADRPTATQLRTLVLLGERARATVAEVHLELDGAPSFANAVSEIVTAAGAHLDHVHVVRGTSATSHVGSIGARQERASTIVSHNLILGGALTRMDLGSTLAGEGAECLLQGLHVTGPGEHVDNHTTLEHASPHCPSRELYKGILFGDARAIFNGRIIVRPGAQKTDAKQSNRNLLLSGEATVHTRPQLEIYANDVKCTHGATIGRLDAEAMFYLRSRGLSEPQSRALLISAFAGEVLDRIPAPALRAALRREVAHRLGFEPPEAEAR